MQTRRYIRLLALLKLGDVLPSELVGRVVYFDLLRNCHRLNRPRSCRRLRDFDPSAI